MGVARFQIADRRTGGAEMLRDLASEIEWAKASLIGPSGYEQAVIRADREPPAPAEQVAQVFAAYEAAKIDANGDRLLDFDDLLIFTTQILADDPGLAEEFRSRYRCFVVDEYQDVTPTPPPPRSRAPATATT